MKTGVVSRRLIWPAIAAGLAFSFAGVPAASKPSESKPAAILTDDSRGVTVTQTGVPVDIRLRAQAGTGFSWVVTRSARYVTELDTDRGLRKIPGVAQFQRFRFAAIRPGTYRVSFSYDQPWKDGTKGARTKDFVITVR